MAAQIVPLTKDPDQTLRVSLDVDARTVTLGLRVKYNAVAGYWQMSVSDATGNLLLDSQPMVTGLWPAGNLLMQQRYLGIGSAFLVNASGVAQDYADDTNLGTDFVLLWSDTPAA